MEPERVGGQQWETKRIEAKNGRPREREAKKVEAQRVEG